MRKMTANTAMPTFDMSQMMSKVKSEPMMATRNTIYLYGDIKEPSYYLEELDAINSMGEDDYTNIIINSNGGDLDTVLSFLSAMRSCEGHIHIHIEGICASAATFIALQGSTLSCAEHSVFMVHQPRGVIGGSFSEMYSQVDFYREWTRNLYTDIYTGFLTPEEIDHVLQGNDMWLDAEKTSNRLQSYFEHMRDEMLAQMEENDEE